MNNKNNNNIVQMPPSNDLEGNDDTINPQSQGNGNGGGNNMGKNDYVTHEELNHATDNLSNEIKLLGKDIDNKFEKLNTQFEKINTKFAEQDNKFTRGFDQIDKKFSDQKLWFILTGVSIVASTCGILGFLINLFK